MVSFFTKKLSRLSYLVILTIFLITQTTTTTKASHLMGGDINYVEIGPNMIQVTMRLYQDCNGSSLLGQSESIDINSVVCQASITATLTLVQTNDVSPNCSTMPSACNGGTGQLGVEEYIYSGTIVLPFAANCDWTISWSDCCRNGGITTLAGGGQGTVIPVSYFPPINSTVFNNSSPVFTNRPLFYVCSNQASQLSLSANDLDGDSLVYALADCKANSSSNVNYATGYNATNPMAGTTTIDAQTGILTIFPSAVQVAVVCVLIEEYRSGVKIGETLRDIQITALTCSNKQPYASGINGTATINGITGSMDTSVCVGEQLCFTFDLFDPDATNILSAEYIGLNPSVNLTLNNALPTIGTICWTPTAQNIGINGIPIRIVDNVCPIMGESFVVYQVNVLSNPVVGITSSSLTIDLGDSTSIGVSTNSAACTINWSPSAGLSCTNCPSPMASPTATTTYYANFDCCSSTMDSITIVVDSCSTISNSTINTTSTSILIGDSVMIMTTLGDSSCAVTWLPSIGLSCANCPNPTATPIIPTTYYATFDCGVNCISVVDSITIDVSTIGTKEILDIQNISVFPNPSKGQTILEYDLTKSGNVQIEVFDILGKQLQMVANERQTAGRHQYFLNQTKDWQTGIYFIKLTIDGQSVTKKWIVQP